MATGRQSDNDEVRRAAREGLAIGLHRHLPGAVGLVTKGIPLCGLAAFAHLVLGIEISGSAFSTVIAYLCFGRWMYSA